MINTMSRKKVPSPKRQVQTALKGQIRFGESKRQTKLDRAPEYLQLLVDKNHSAWTIHLVRSALRKIYQNQDLAKDVQLPERKKMDITRSRGPKSSDVNFSVTKNQGLMDFSKATGLRRMELTAVRVDQIQENPDGTVTILGIHGKGGREREAPVIAGQVHPNHVALMIVSHALGYPREDVVVRNYL